MPKMTEKELIVLVKKLDRIQPRQSWVFSCKKELFKGETAAKSPSFVEILEAFARTMLQPKLVLAGTLAVFITLGGLYFPVKNSLPSEPLYLAKRVYEKGRAFLASNSELVEVQLDVANNRLEDLEKIARNNQVQKLTPALEAYQASIVEAAKYKN